LHGGRAKPIKEKAIIKKADRVPTAGPKVSVRAVIALNCRHKELTTGRIA
jgi:hypothetical protein